MTDDRLRVIPGDRIAKLPRAGRRKSLDQCEQVTCSHCERDTGIPTSRFRKAIVAPRRRPDGRWYGGTQVWVCDYCGTAIQIIKR